MHRANGNPPNASAGGLAKARLRALLLAAGVAAGATAEVGADAARWFGVRGPHCPLGQCLGPLACPGCGLVRSVSATLQGDFPLAVNVHPAGPAVAGLMLAALAVNLEILRRGHETASLARWRHRGFVSFVAFVFGGWLLRLVA